MRVSHLKQQHLISGRAPYRLKSLKAEEDFCREHYFVEDARLIDVIEAFLTEKGESGALKSEIQVAVDGIFSQRLTPEQRGNNSSRDETTQPDRIRAQTSMGSHLA